MLGACKILFGKSERRQPLTFALEHTIKKGVRVVGLKLVDCINLAQDCLEDGVEPQGAMKRENLMADFGS